VKLHGTGRASVAGLTLVEVVAALVLLSILGGAVLPVLVSARRAAAIDKPILSHADLARLADDWLASRDGVSAKAAPIDLQRKFDNGRRQVDVRIRTLGPHSESVGHQWLAFESDGTSVLRCVAPPPA